MLDMYELRLLYETEWKPLRGKLPQPSGSGTDYDAIRHTYLAMAIDEEDDVVPKSDIDILKSLTKPVTITPRGLSPRAKTMLVVQNGLYASEDSLRRVELFQSSFAQPFLYATDVQASSNKENDCEQAASQLDEAAINEEVCNAETIIHVSSYQDEFDPANSEVPLLSSSMLLSKSTPKETATSKITVSC